ncbi:hypothetical protein EJ08DRAFT_679113 [Tothia fuscella]|uniref:Uncharacterized protein n=1 Tax=Tothia fuscella TaxID=1048955 RepID=A0A9P4NSS4_9PEZI|nr:hypothetical protein EJ08DRAFT_679113 [Tothia fuscella]
MTRLQGLKRDDDCPAGYQWYVCSKNGFRGCCSDSRVCDLDGGCPNGKSPGNSVDASSIVSHSSSSSAEPSTTAQSTKTNSGRTGGIPQALPIAIESSTLPKIETRLSPGLTINPILTDMHDVPSSTPTTFATATSVAPSPSGNAATSPTSTPLSPAARKNNASLIGGVLGAVVVLILAVILFLLLMSRRRMRKKEAKCIKDGAEKGSGANGGTYGTAATELDSPTSISTEKAMQTPMSSEFPLPPNTSAKPVEADPVPHLDSREVKPKAELPGPIPLSQPPSHILELPNSEVSSPKSPDFRSSVDATKGQDTNKERLSTQSPLSSPPTGSQWANLDSSNAGMLASQLPLSRDTTAAALPPSPVSPIHSRDTSANTPHTRSPSSNMISSASISPPTADYHSMAWAAYEQDGAVENKKEKGKERAAEVNISGDGVVGGQSHSGDITQNNFASTKRV